MAQLSLRTETLAKDIILVEVGGYLYAHSAEEVSNLFKDHISRGIYKFIVQLNRLQYIASAGVGAFIEARALAQEEEGDLIFIDPSPVVRDLFEMLGLDRLFRFAADCESAISLLE